MVWGSPGTRYTNNSLPSWQVWAKPLKDNRMAVVVVRVWDSGADTRISLPFGEFYGPGSAPIKVAVRDIHAHTDNGTVTGKIAPMTVLPHQTIVVRLTKA